MSSHFFSFTLLLGYIDYNVGYMTNTKPIHSCVFTHALKQVLHLIMCLTCAEALKKLKSET